MYYAKESSAALFVPLTKTIRTKNSHDLADSINLHYFFFASYRPICISRMFACTKNTMSLQRTSSTITKLITCPAIGKPTKQTEWQACRFPRNMASHFFLKEDFISCMFSDNRHFRRNLIQSRAYRYHISPISNTDLPLLYSSFRTKSPSFFLWKRSLWTLAVLPY